MKEWKSIIEAAWENQVLLKETVTQQCIRTIIEEIDKGRLRTAEPTSDGWQVNDWVKKASDSIFPYSTNGNHRNWTFRISR